MLLTAGLFISVFTLLFFLMVPIGEYDVSPATMTVEALRHRMESMLTKGDKGEKLAIMGRTMGDVIKAGMVAGFGLSLLGLLSFKFFGALSLVLAVALFILGLGITQVVMGNEFKRWQSKVLASVPTLLNFVPAFLEVGSVTPREALSHTLPLLGEPLKSELWRVVDLIARTGRVQDAFDGLANRVKHPLMDAICFRLSSTWDTKMTPDIFSDLADQVDEIKEEEIHKATVAKSGFLALICVIGLLGAVMVFGYPGFKFLAVKLSSGFGF